MGDQIGINDGCTALRKQVGYSRFSAAYAASQANGKVWA